LTERALYLEAGLERLFAVHHPPQGRSQTAVVLVPPFGWEEIATHRARREWAIQLARAGRHVLRIDLPGTGDSEGDLDEAGRWDSWSAAVRSAAAWLRSESGASRVAAIGLGTGGYVAAEAAAAGEVDDLVLWGTPARGRQYLRELAAFGALESGRVVEGGGPPSPPPSGGGVEAGGFVLPEAVAATIGAIDLAGSVLPAHARVLLLDRDGVGATDKLADSLRANGSDVETARGSGYAAMLAPPDESVPPREAFAVVDGWLARGADAPSAPTTDVAVVRATLELDGVRERPLEIERPGLVLRGIVSESSSEVPQPLTLVFLNAAAIRRIGPHRLWTETARRWAERGVPAFRLDLDGIGDADGDGERYREVASFYGLQHVDHVTSALDALVAEGLPPRFVLIGLCSGGYWGFQAALRDARVAAAVLMNTRILYWHEHLDSFRDLQRTRLLVRAVVWKRILRGEVSWERWRSFARTMALSTAVRLHLRRRTFEPSVFDWQAERAAEGFTQLREAGRRAHFVFCDGEPLRNELESAGLLAQHDRWPNVSERILPGREHTLSPSWMHPYVVEALDDVIRSELALGSERRDAAPAA
jgi:alpha-beta hydrolase superfamily lysophospholipase